MGGPILVEILLAQQVSNVVLTAISPLLNQPLRSIELRSATVRLHPAVDATLGRTPQFGLRAGNASLFWSKVWYD
jgi:hypothetical protein